jgi:uncharacterized membrane protein YphA (DoxX/SURF4 family)
MQPRFLFFIFFLAFPLFASAHVGYVLDDAAVKANAGRDDTFLFQVIADPAQAILALIIVTGLVFAGWFIYRTAALRRVLDHIDREARGYRDIYGWILRLSAGIALIGAGTSGALISPALSASGRVPFLEILVGFLLLAGFLTGPAALIAATLYLIGLARDPYLFGNLDFLGVAVGLLFLADHRPGIDHLLGIPFAPSFTKFRALAPAVARISVGLAMTFLAVYEKFLNPHLSALVVQKYDLQSIIPVSAPLWVLGAGAVEFAVGMLLVLGFLPRLTSAVAFLVLSLSFFYFQEAVYSHITLFGALSFVFVAGEPARDSRKKEGAAAR